MVTECIIDRIRDPFSENDGMWYVALKKGKSFRIVFMDVYKSVCVFHAKMMDCKIDMGV